MEARSYTNAHLGIAVIFKPYQVQFVPSLASASVSHEALDSLHLVASGRPLAEKEYSGRLFSSFAAMQGFETRVGLSNRAP